MTLRPEGPSVDLDGLRELLDAAQECVTGVLVELELFSCHSVLCVGWLSVWISR